MKGLVIYCREDYSSNQTFVDWLREEFAGHHAELDLVFLEDFAVEKSDYSKYDFVINRSRDYNISLLFELNGIRVFNSSQVTLLGNNKLAGYEYAMKRGYPFAKVLLPNHGSEEKVISKPIYGHGGKGIKLLKEEPLWLTGNVNQSYAEHVTGDLRFYILKNRVYCAVLRQPKSGFLSNFSQGGEFSFYSYTEKEKKYVEDFIADLTVDYAGIDFLRTKDGKLLFNEIEDAVGSRMLTRLGKNTIIPIWIKDIIENCRRR